MLHERFIPSDESTNYSWLLGFRSVGNCIEIEKLIIGFWQKLPPHRPDRV